MTRLRQILGFALIGSLVWAAPDHDHDHSSRSGGGGGRPSQSAGAQPAGCPSNPSGLARFANGEAYDFGSLVPLISNPNCLIIHPRLSRSAIAMGVTFQSSGPYKMDHLAKQMDVGASATASSQIDARLGKSIPQILRENPLSSTEMLPILGQLALLSPTAARTTLSALIRQQTQEAGDRMAKAKADMKPTMAADLAGTLLMMGALDPVIASDLGEGIEDLALTVQADSLARFFRGLSAAATAEESLAPTFNLTATALNRGTQKGAKVASEEKKGALLKAVFEAIRSSLGGSGLMEPGTAQLNEALGTLVDGRSLSLTSLQNLWRQATAVLQKSTNQHALAEAVAASLTPQMVFLRPDAKQTLLLAAANYPWLAQAVQKNFLAAWTKAWDRMASGGMGVQDFNRLKQTYFEPMVGPMLDFPPEAIDSGWLRSVYHWGLVRDEQVEQKFPRLFLAQLQRRERAVASVVSENSPDAFLEAFAENFAVLWSVHQAHLPALGRWVRKYEQ